MSQVIFVINQSHGDPPRVEAPAGASWQADRAGKVRNDRLALLLSWGFFNPEQEGVITPINFLRSKYQGDCVNVC